MKSSKKNVETQRPFYPGGPRYTRVAMPNPITQNLHEGNCHKPVLLLTSYRIHHVQVPHSALHSHVLGIMGNLIIILLAFQPKPFSLG